MRAKCGLGEFHAGRRAPALLDMLNGNGRVQTAANVEPAGQAQEAGFQSVHEITVDLAGDGLVKRPLIPVVPDVEFEGFQFHATRVRHVFEKKRGEIGLSRDRA